MGPGGRSWVDLTLEGRDCAATEDAAEDEGSSSDEVGGGSGALPLPFSPAGCPVCGRL